MAEPLHATLLRQLRRGNASVDNLPDVETWQRLLQSVSRAYQTADEDRYTIERALELTSAEMKGLYDRLAEERDRLSRELEIARVLQTALLPRSTRSTFLDIAAHMAPATEVGGDYYEILSVASDACWLAIGDVTGHGLRAAIGMMMVQSMVAALVRSQPDASPKTILAQCNRALWEGLHHRLRVDDHMTCTLLRVRADGSVVFAGAHEDVLVSRAGRPCEQIETSGTWLGVTPEVEAINEDRAIALAHGDVMVLYTDGVIEAANAQREQFGHARLCAVIDEHRAEPVEAIRDAVVAALAAWTTVQDDDVTLVVVRYR